MARAKVSNIDHQGLLDYLHNRTWGCAGLAEGTNANTIKITNAFHFEIGGNLFYKAVTDNIAMTACAQQAVGTTCYYTVSIGSTGAVAVKKGTATKLAEPGDNRNIIGVIKVVTDATHTFTSGTTDLSAAGVTATYANLGFYPVGGSIAEVSMDDDDTFDDLVTRDGRILGGHYS